MIIYRYLLLEYLKVLFLSVFSFIAILLTTRLEEIARFAAAGGSGLAILKFTVLQIPYILPIVVAVSSLISAIVLSLRLSHSQELTTLRASGLSLKSILSPVLITSAFISIINFLIVSEMATESILKTRKMQRELSLINPLALIQNKHLIRHKDVYIDAQNRSLGGSSLQNLTVAVWNNPVKRINLALIKEMGFEEPIITARNMAMFSSFTPNENDNYDNLYIENIADSSMDIEGLSLYLKQKAAKLNDDYLKMSLLLSRINSLKDELKNGNMELKSNISKAYSEIFRRISMGLTVFTLTLLGSSFGISTGRQRSYRSAYYVIGLTSILLVCIFSAKAFGQYITLSFLFYFLPQIIIIFLAEWNLKRISRGIE